MTSYRFIIILMMVLVVGVSALFAAENPESETELFPAQSGCAIDLMLALDGSGSIAPADFDLMKSFVRQLTGAFVISPNDANVGIIQFSDTAELYLNLSEDPAAVARSIDNMTQFGNRTDIAGAIKLAQEQFIIRRNIPRVIILLTDGLHNMGGNPIAQADIARANGTVVLGIAVGTFDPTEINAIAGNNVFSVGSFQDLSRILDSLVSTTCSVAFATPVPVTVATLPLAPTLDSATPMPAAPTPTIASTVAPAANVTRVGKIVFSSTRDGDYEIFMMDENGNNVQQLTSNGSRDDYPAFSPDGSKIAWESNLRGDNSEIWVMNSDGSGQTRLTTEPADDWGPAWSPDGSQIAFYSARNRQENASIWVMNADGSNARQLSPTMQGFFDSSPTWSPDGTQVMYFSDKTGGRELHIVNVASGAEIQVTSDETYDGYPDWSADGARVVLESNHDANENSPDVFILDLTSNTFTRLTDQLGTDGDPAWSPDGTRVVFHSGRTGNLDIWLIDANGTNLVALTDNEATDSSPDWGLVPVVGGATTTSTGSVATVAPVNNSPVNTAPAGPKDTQIAFASERDGDLEIFVMDGDGTNVRQLTSNNDDDDEPSWSPDGRLLAWESNIRGTMDIWVMNADGTDQRQLTTSNSNEHNPVWSPDGSQIAYHADQGGDFEIWVMNADGSGAKMITSNSLGDDMYPTWSPDGTKLAYQSDKTEGREVYVIDLATNAEQQLTSNEVYDGRPDWSWLGNQLVFGANRAGDNPDLYIINPDGSGLRPLLEQLGTDDNAVWSPDGLQLAYESGKSGNFDIWIVNADGQAARQLTDSPARDISPDWSWKP